MAQITFPWAYVPDPTSGRPIANGKLFFGVKDLDPTIPANQITVRGKQEDGTLVNLTQPVATNAGGVPTYNGSPIILDAEESEFSLLVKNANDVQIYYNENIIPLTIDSGQIADGAITTPKLADNAVTEPKIADDAVAGPKLNDAVAGDGLSKDGSENLQVNVDDSTIEIDSDTLRVKADGITSSELAPDSVGSSEIATGAVGSPEISAGAVGQSEIGAGAVHQSELDTSRGTVTQNSTVGANFVLPGGEYGFYPDVEDLSGNGDAQIAVAYNVGSRTTNIWMVANGGTHAIRAGQRYINSSPPFDIGDGEIPLFVYAKIKNNKIIGTYTANVPPWAYNGPTSISGKFCKKRGKKFQSRRKRSISSESDFIDYMEGDRSELEEAEVTNAIKNADMNIIPHPFSGGEEPDSIVLLDPCETLKLADLHDEGIEINELFQAGYLKLDNDFLTEKDRRQVGNNVNIMRIRWK